MSNLFNERTHAHLIGLFYKHLQELHAQQGVAVFVKASQKMAEQRGARMALRVLRDGLPLNFRAYAAYGEWTPTFPRRSDDISTLPDKETKSYLCAWHDEFVDMGLLECGLIYCKEIDRGIVRGYNPDLVFVLKSYLHDSDCCHMLFQDGYDGPEIPPNAAAKMPWEYHCGHVYKTYVENVLAVYPQDAALIEQVEQDFAAKYGEPALNTVKGYLTTDFNTI